MLIKILCNKMLLDRATSQLASCTEPSRAGSLFSRATKTGSARARSERRAGPSRVELLRARASSSSSSFFPALVVANVGDSRVVLGIAFDDDAITSSSSSSA
jgi:serine/threonine protein phosphatase PrpC